ncbi:EamA family transporter [candidate division WOR-3 bacterium]|nr:EamA family transporter [candidate division WOR-3 bacterium]
MKGIIYIIICILINVAGQSSIKYGASAAGKLSLDFNQLGPFFVAVFKQPFILLGFILYGIGAFFWIGALSRIELSFAYPMLSVSYVLILLISWKFFGEAISLYRIFGIILIAAGVVFLAKSL